MTRKARSNSNPDIILDGISQIIERAFPTPSGFQSYVLESLVRLLRENLDQLHITRQTMLRQQRLIENLEYDLAQLRMKRTGRPYGSDDHNS